MSNCHNCHCQSLTDDQQLWVDWAAPHFLSMNAACTHCLHDPLNWKLKQLDYLDHWPPMVAFWWIVAWMAKARKVHEPSQLKRKLGKKLWQGIVCLSWLSVIRPQCLIVCWSTVDYDWFSSPIQLWSTIQTGNSIPKLSPQLLFFHLDGCMHLIQPICNFYQKKQLMQILQIIQRLECALRNSSVTKNPDFQIWDSGFSKGGFY